MTKYSVSVLHNGEWNGVALFADTMNFHAIVTFCYEQFECGNSLTTPGEDMTIVDLGTGEVLWSWQAAQDGEYDEEWLNDDDYWDDGCPIEPANIDDDCGFDPYEGCYTYDC